jgi:flagellar protein FlgJ
MLSSGIDAKLLAKQADTSDLVRFKQEMDGLKGRLSGDSGDKSKQLRKACENFEAVFISKMWQEMRNTVPKEGYMHSKQEDMYISMFDKDFAEKMAQSGGIGLADMIYDQLSQKLKESSRDTLNGAVDIKPLGAPTIPLKSGGIALQRTEDGMTLEDWGGTRSAGAPAAEAADESGYPSQPAMTDVDVKARLETLTRRLEAERIKTGLMGTGVAEKTRSYGRDTESGSSAKVGRSFARNG